MSSLHWLRGPFYGICLRPKPYFVNDLTSIFMKCLRSYLYEIYYFLVYEFIYFSILMIRSLFSTKFYWLLLKSWFVYFIDFKIFKWSTWVIVLLGVFLLSHLHHSYLVIFSHVRYVRLLIGRDFSLLVFLYLTPSFLSFLLSIIETFKQISVLNV